MLAKMFFRDSPKLDNISFENFEFIIARVHDRNKNIVIDLMEPYVLKIDENQLTSEEKSDDI